MTDKTPVQKVSDTLKENAAEKIQQTLDELNANQPNIKDDKPNG